MIVVQVLSKLHLRDKESIRFIDSKDRRTLPIFLWGVGENLIRDIPFRWVGGITLKEDGGRRGEVGSEVLFNTLKDIKVAVYPLLKATL